ncbi:MAG: diaminopimelate decarboxylase [Candidatus Diapherotrites archaeon]|nr:diaminopimelate decarboxylase [Candidatus Diapherotrites archaeon]
MHAFDNRLFLGDFKAVELAELYGTPLYVYEEEEIKRNFRKIKESIKYSHTRIHYAMFCNNNRQILKLLREEGALITATCPGDAFIAMKAGFLPGEIIISGTNMGKEDFLFIKEKGIQINVDSLGQLEDFCRLNPKGRAGLRVNLKVRLPEGIGSACIGRESRLGLEERQLKEALKIASKYKVKINGLQTYLGTNLLEVPPFIAALKRLALLAEKIDSIEYLDLGGGFGVDYSEKPKEFNVEEFGKEVTGIMEKLSEKKGKRIALIIEPGRSIMAKAGVLLTKVVSIKHTCKTFVGTDTCFAHFMRPFVYNAEHTILKAGGIESKRQITADICGNTTLSVDFLGRDKKLPPVKKGDILAILGAGAYGYAMSNHFLSRPRPAEVLVSGKKSRIIREREKLGDLL